MEQLSPAAVANRQKVEAVLDHLRIVLAPVATEKLRLHFGDGWWEQAVKPRLNAEQQKALERLRTIEEQFAADPQVVLQSFVWNWNEIFKVKFVQQIRGYIYELIDFRNLWAHFHPVGSDDAVRAVDTANRLCEALKVPTFIQKQDLVEPPPPPPENSKLADRIRAFVVHRYIDAARVRNQSTIEIRAGDVHRDMGLQGRVPAVCGALTADKFAQENRLTLISAEGPNPGMNLILTFEVKP